MLRSMPLPSEVSAACRSLDKHHQEITQMKRNVTAVAGLILGLMTASTLEAQMARPVQFGIGAGLTIPGGEVEGVEVGDVFDNGYHVQGMLAFKAPMFPVGLRLD